MWSVDDAVERPRLLTMAGPLIGRAGELETVLHLLADPAVRVVVLTGPSGVGKTRLALAALDAAPVDARVLVPLSSIPDGDVMGDAIAAEVALPGVAIRRPADALWQSFGGHPVLLLLDNLEQVVGAAETLLDLLESDPEVTVLATSLREVGVPGERLVRLVPLEVPQTFCRAGRPDRPGRPHPAGRTGRPGAGDVPRAGHGEGRRRPPRGLGPRGGGAHLPQRRGPAAGHPAGGGARGVAAPPAHRRPARGRRWPDPARAVGDRRARATPQPARRPHLDHRPAATGGGRPARGAVRVRGARHPRGHRGRRAGRRPAARPPLHPARRLARRGRRHRARGAAVLPAPHGACLRGRPAGHERGPGAGAATPRPADPGPVPRRAPPAAPRGRRRPGDAGPGPAQRVGRRGPRAGPGRGRRHRRPRCDGHGRRPRRGAAGAAR